MNINITLKQQSIPHRYEMVLFKLIYDIKVCIVL